jgi:hypothetical protein
VTAPVDAVVTAAQQLYAVPPEAFIARRKEMVAAAKADGAKEAAAEIGRLRRPSVAAWAVNTVVRAEPDVVGDLLALGSRMRAAQGALDVAALQAMRGERDAAIDEFVSAAVACLDDAGRPLAPAGRDEVRDTAIAVLADQSAADAVASGILTKALSYSGFGEVDLSDALAVTGTGVVLTALAGGAATGGVTGAAAGERTAYEGDGTGDDAAVQAAREAAVDAARREVDDAEAADAHARATAEQASTALTAAEAALDEARRHLKATRTTAEGARAADRAARDTLTETARRRKQALAALARLTQETP